MLRVIALVAFLVPATASAESAPMVQAQLSFRDFLHGVVEKLESWNDTAIPDLSILTTEPVERTESSGYGWREDPVRRRGRRFHAGADFRADPGTPVLAAGDGVVVFAKRWAGYGNVVFIDHGGGVITRYAHMRKIETKVGAAVTAGTRIGQVGSTGRTTGPHLHFEVRLDGRPVDPNTALAIAELAREKPGLAHIASFALAPELQRAAKDLQDRKNRRELLGRPERRGAPKRDRALW